MKKIALLLAIITIPLATFAQGSFDSFENEKDVTSVVVTKNMFKLLSKMDLNSNDPEVEDYLKNPDTPRWSDCWPWTEAEEDLGQQGCLTVMTLTMGEAWLWEPWPWNQIGG